MTHRTRRTAVRLLAAATVAAVPAASVQAQGAAAPAAADAPPAGFSGAIKAQGLPPAPQGLDWVRLDAIDVAVLVPTGWTRHERSARGSRLFAFSDEPPDARGQFQRGFTVTATWSSSERALAASSVSAMLNGRFAALRADPANSEVSHTASEQHGKRVLVTRHRSSPAGMPPIIVHTMHIGDPKSGLVYLFTVQAPESRWGETWRLGEPMLRSVYVSFPDG